MACPRRAVGQLGREHDPQLGTLTFEEKQMALEALDVRATVWRADYPNQCYVITASVPVEPHTGHDSSFSDASQNIHS